MAWWLRATLGWPSLVASLVSVLLILSVGDFRVPYPTLRGGGQFQSSAIAVLLAVLPPVLWLNVRRRAKFDQKVGPVRSRIPVLDIGLALLFPAVLVVATSLGFDRASLALVPAMANTAFVVVAALPQLSRELQVLPAIGLTGSMMLGHRGGSIEWWAVSITEVPEGLPLLLATFSLIAAGSLFIVLSSFGRR